MAHLASSVSYGTIKSYLCAVCSLQIVLGYGDALVATPRLEHVLRGIRHVLSLKSPIRLPRLPVTQNLMLLIRTSLNLTNFDHAMFWAAFCTAWFVFWHVSEFTSPPSGFDPAVHLSLNDVAVDCHLHPSAVFLTIKASKTDPFRKGVQLYLLRTDRLIYPVSSLSYFLHHRGNLSGPLFVFSDGTALSRRHVTDRLCSILAAAGLDGNFSSHSFRERRWPLGLLIRTLGRWSSVPISCTCVPQKLLFTRQLHGLPPRGSLFFRFRFAVLTIYLSLKSFSRYSCLLNFLLPPFRPDSTGECKVSRTSTVHPLRCLEPSSLTGRQPGVGFHSNRPCTDPSVGPPPSLWGHSTGALSPLHSSQTLSPRIA